MNYLKEGIPVPHLKLSSQFGLVDGLYKCTPFFPKKCTKSILPTVTK